MALIKCPECKKEVSDKAVSCPNCGYQIPKKEFCRSCGAQINQGVAFCPQCGAEVEPRNNGGEYYSRTPQYANYNNEKINGLCLSGMIVSICSLFLDFFGLTAITGIVLSSIGLSQVKGTYGKNRNFAIAGIIIGSIEAVLKFIQLMNYYG